MSTSETITFVFNQTQPTITCSKLTYFTPGSIISIVNFEQLNGG